MRTGVLANLRAPGALHLQVYEPGTYPGDADNWAALADAAGRLYVGNGKGLFLVSGNHVSSLITLPNKGIVRSLAKGDDGRIYVGGAGELGYLASDAAGQLVYHSLLEHLPAEQRDFGDVWKSEAYGDVVFFYTYRQLMRWSTTERMMQIWRFEDTVVLVSGLETPMLQNMHTGGLLRMVGNDWEEVMRSPTLTREPLRLLVPRTEDTLAVTGRSLYALQAGRMKALPSVIGAEGSNAWIYDAEPLPGGDLALATLYNGVVFVDVQGRAIRRLSRAEGLPDDVALALAYDAGGLWLCLERGLVRADLASGVTFYGEREGLHAYASDLSEWGGEVYLAGLQRFARLPRQAGAGLDVLAAPTDEVLALAATPQGLLVASRGGLDVYDGRGLKPVSRFHIAGDYPVALRRSAVDTTRLYVGYRSGLAVLHLEGGQWVMRETIPQVDEIVSSIAEAADGSLWLGTDQQFLLRVSFVGGAVSVQRYGQEEGLPRLVATPFRLGDDILIHTPDGFFRPEGHRIVPDSSTLSALFDYRPRGVKNLHVSPEGDVWMVMQGTPGVARRTAYGYRWESINDGLVSKGINNNAWSLGGAVWVAQTNRLVRIEPGRALPAFETHLVSVQSAQGDSVFYGGFGAPAMPRLAARKGLRFDVGAPRFEGVQFRYRLEGLDDTWSLWTDASRHEYTTLPAGHYVFHAQARDRFGNMGAGVSYPFTVEPAWYATPLALMCYGLLGLGLLALSMALSVRYQRRRSQAHQQALEHEVELRTREADAQKKILQHLNATLRGSNERLQELSEQKSRLLSIAAHDLKAPLANIYSLSDIVLEERDSGEPNYEFIELIQRTARDMSQLIENVLTSAAAETGQVGLQCIPTDLATLAERAVEQCVGMAERKGQQLAFRSHPVAGPALVMGDELRLMEAMTNLVSNAVKYSPLEGAISVDIVCEQDRACFFVTDNGPGLTEEDRERLFQPFQRLSAQPTSGESSSGLGLYIVRQYIELHGGIVGVESAPGEGCTFWFCLPTLSADVRQDAMPVGAESENPA